MLVLEPLDHENGVVVSETEDEGSQDDVDYIETHAKDSHYARYPDPADNHRKERCQSQFKTAECNPEEEEHKNRTNCQNLVEVILQNVYHPVCH